MQCKEQVPLEPALFGKIAMNDCIGIEGNSITIVVLR